MNPIIGTPIYQNIPTRARSNRSIDPFLNNSAKTLLSPEPKTTMFISEKERFERDFAAEERRRRELENQRKMEAFNKRRENAINREINRWESLNQDYAKSIEKLEIRRSKWKNGQKNNPSEAFNPITLDYDPTDQGEYLKRKDDLAKQRAMMRLYNLDAKRNSAFNILNGAPRQGPPLPSFYL
ncbi:unnamed protein product [Blepharisma stoltei]|uniref:Uncharacterized protein n=1 Tax=Blepharisma stoltei TaxID=1481888 RepID=A0AAU9JMM4_9CILI|nr:unnamed protein product [Blepharisma stoltei]